MSPRIEFIETCPRWRRALPSRKLAREAIGAGAAEASLALARGAEMTLHLSDDAGVRDLNKRFRHKDAATNVLSFPAAPAAKLATARLLGDVFVALETLEREASDEGKPLADHFRHLVLHGFLHLIGYDHETPSEAEAMEALERRALARIGVPDPYSGAELATGT